MMIEARRRDERGGGGEGWRRRGISRLFQGSKFKAALGAG